MSGRPIKPDQSDLLWKQLEVRWQADGTYWYPLRAGSPSFETLAFHKDYFDRLREQKLRDILKLHGVDTIFELREGRWQELEIEVDSFEPYYSGMEGYWVDLNLDWLVYASHESSITLAGGWLTRAVRAADPGCECLQYEGPYSTSDLRGTADPNSPRRCR